MALNLKELSNFVLPLVQDGKVEDAKNLLTQAGKKQPASRVKSGGGLLDAVGGLLGGGKGGGSLLDSVGGLLGGGKGGNLLDSLSGMLGKNDGGLIGSLGGLLGSGDAGPLSGLVAILPALLKLIKPEHTGTVASYLSDLVNKEKKTPAKKPAAKKPAATRKTAPVKKATPPKKPAAKKTTTTRKTTPRS